MNLNGSQYIENFRNVSDIEKESFQKQCTEKISTATTREQTETEFKIRRCYERVEQLRYFETAKVALYKDLHIRYLEKSLKNLSCNYECLDCSRCWLIYWVLNAAHLLRYKFCDEVLDNAIDFLIKCRDPKGGFGGGPGQFPHLATTYAAVNSLCIIGTEKAYNAIDRNKLKDFLFSVREPNGAFRLHCDGEMDLRGAYCAVSCAVLLNFVEKDMKELFKDTPKWIQSCQTYEGGFGGTPDLEAHGGYTFCGIAALVMLGCSDLCNLDALLKWSVARQMRLEGGFQGRTNKLVDGCYSFWVGAIIPIVQSVLALKENKNKNNSIACLLERSLFDRAALQEYVLLCCQSPNGGLIDKPGKGPDLYHTCYTLSGLSIAQHCEYKITPFILGSLENEVLPTHPLHNISPEAVMFSYRFFEKLNKQAEFTNFKGKIPGENDDGTSQENDYSSSKENDYSSSKENDYCSSSKESDDGFDSDQKFSEQGES